LSDETTNERRRYERVNAVADVLVSWTIGGRTLVSPVTDLGLGGIFIVTPNPELLESRIQLKFVVQEGEIRALGTVRYSKLGKGMGVEFTDLSERIWVVCIETDSALTAKNLMRKTFKRVIHGGSIKDSKKGALMRVPGAGTRPYCRRVRGVFGYGKNDRGLKKGRRSGRLCHKS
jgi:hypothetical protein